jgi:hypothetical protein
LAYRCNCGEDPPYYSAVVREWERRYETVVQTNFLPHDADSKELSGKSYRDYLRECGLPNTQVVTVCDDKWLGIQRLRSLLPRFVFHKTNCGTEWFHEGRIMPSGIGCLEGYHTKQDASSGVIKEMPVHDENSHGADALRCLAEAELKGLLPGTSMIARQSQGGERKVILAGWNAARGDWRPKPRSILA